MDSRSPLLRLVSLFSSPQLYKAPENFAESKYSLSLWLFYSSEYERRVRAVRVAVQCYSSGVRLATKTTLFWRHRCGGILHGSYIVFSFIFFSPGK